MNGQKLKFIAAEPMTAPENAGTRKTEKSNMGRGLTLSAMRKAMKLTIARPMTASPVVLAKPRS